MPTASTPASTPVAPGPTSAASSTRTVTMSIGSATGAARDRADRTAAGLSLLFAGRPELRGVHAPADLAEDFIRWSA